MREIASFPNLEAAYIAKGMLENYGIESEVQQNGVSSVFPAPGAYNGGIVLCVADSDTERAMQLLKEHND